MSKRNVSGGSALQAVCGGFARLTGAIALLFALVCASFTCVGASPASAAAEPYTYTITLSAGRQGTLNADEITVQSAATKKAADYVTILGDSSRLSISGLQLGDRVSFGGAVAVPAEGGKYYVRGVRYAGRDNNTALDAPAFQVEGDRDYVIAYKQVGNLVEYTVRYVDADGNELGTPRTYSGNVGDKPVVACLYFEGYQPQSYNLAKTLSENPDENVLTFVYDVIEEPVAPAPEGADAGAGTGAGAGTTGAGAGAAATTAGAPATPAAGDAGAGAAAGAAGAEGAAVAEDGAAAEAEAATDAAAATTEEILDDENALIHPEEIQDLDNIEDDAAPLVQLPGSIASEDGSGLHPLAVGGLGALAALVLAGVAALVMYKRGTLALAGAQVAGDAEADGAAAAGESAGPGAGENAGAVTAASVGAGADATVDRGGSSSRTGAGVAGVGVAAAAATDTASQVGSGSSSAHASGLPDWYFNNDDDSADSWDSGSSTNLSDIIDRVSRK